MADESIIKRSIRLLREQGTEKIAVVTGYKNEILEEHLADTDAVCVYNESFINCSSYDSYMLGLESLAGDCFDRIFLLGGGDPVLDRNTFRVMMEDDCDIVIPRFLNDRGKPILINAGTLKTLEEIAASSYLRAAEYFESHVHEVDVDDEGVVMDIDTKQDYELLLKLFYTKSGRRASLRMELNLKMGTEELFFDNDTALLLELISVTGSISSACHAMNISYTKGWKLINKVEEKFDRKVISRNVGGNDGGGCALTRDGQYLLDSYNYMQRELSSMSDKLFKKLFN